MLSLLAFTIFNFLMAISIEVLSLFRQSVEPDTKNGPASPALNFWCSVSRHIKIKIETVQWIKSGIWEKKEGKYSKTLAKIQVTAVFPKRDIWITFLTQISRDFYGDLRHAGA